MKGWRSLVGGGSERGSGTVWVLSLVSLVWFVAVAGVLAGQARATRHQAGAAADLAALAAAGRVARGQPAACASAARVARANGARLRACALRGGVADVTVEVPLPSVFRPAAGAGGATARARAGPSVPGLTARPGQPAPGQPTRPGQSARPGQPTRRGPGR